MYSNLGCILIAIFEGIVQGVVVQIMAYIGFVFPFKIFSLIFLVEASSNSNLTYIDLDETSAYSTSASARAVSQEEHQ